MKNFILTIAFVCITSLTFANNTDPLKPNPAEKVIETPYYIAYQGALSDFDYQLVTKTETKGLLLGLESNIEDQDFKVTIKNVKGHVVYTKTMIKSHGMLLKLDFSKEKEQTYTILINSENNAYEKSFVL